MNAYLFSSIQSAAYGNLFECSTHEENGCDIVFSSMSHENEVGVMDDGEELLFTSLFNTEGLKTKFPSLATEDGIVVRHPKNDLTNHLVLLGELFHAAAQLPPDPKAVLPERTDRIATVTANGLPLAVHLDALFDVGLISFAADGSMMVSPKLGRETIELYGLSEKMRLRNAPTAGQEKYLNYHRRNVFQHTNANA